MIKLVMKYEKCEEMKKEHTLLKRITNTRKISYNEYLPVNCRQAAAKNILLQALCVDF